LPLANTIGGNNTAVGYAHTVDYEALSTLNISATQVLVKEINELKMKNNQMKTELNSLSSRMSNIEEMLKLTAKQ
jgi:prefoldin subunit 5